VDQAGRSHLRILTSRSLSLAACSRSGSWLASGRLGPFPRAQSQSRRYAFFLQKSLQKCDFFKMPAGLVLDSRFSNGTIERLAGPVRRWCKRPRFARKPIVEKHRRGKFSFAVIFVSNGTLSGFHQSSVERQMGGQLRCPRGSQTDNPYTTYRSQKP
jgi:hypothetical protein